MRRVPPGTEPIRRYLINVPLHITGIWKICWGRDEYETGSIGAGIVIEPGVRAVVEIYDENPPKDPIRKTILNGKEIKLRNIEILNRLVSHRKSIIVNCTTPAPLGAGYGVSAALCIIYSLAINECTDIKRAVENAHLAEVKSLLGLGDVIAETYGGELEIRLRPGSPGTTGRIIKICYRKTYNILTTELRKKLYTDEMLRERYSDIVRNSDNLLRKIIEEPSLENFLYCSYMFSKLVRFIDDRIENMLQRVRKMILGYYAKKRVLVIVPEKNYLDEVYEHVRSIFRICRMFRLTREGLHVSALS